MTQDHSPDAGKMVRHEVYAEALMLKDKAWEKADKLEALNRELVEALELCNSALSLFAPNSPEAWKKAKAILAKAKEVA